MPFTLLLAALVSLLVLPPPSAQQQQQQGSRAGWPCAGRVDPSYVQVAEATGGKVLLFHPTELEGASVDRDASRRHPELVVRAAGRFADESFDFDIPIDSTIESAYFFVSVQCLNEVTLLPPTGGELAVASQGVEYHHFESVRMFVVPKPEPGVWKVRAGGKGMFSLIVAAKSDLALSGVTFRADGLPVRSGALGGKTLAVEAIVRGAPRRVAFQFVSANGVPLGQFVLQGAAADDRITFAGQVSPPPGDFRVAATGEDAAGRPFQRVVDRLFLAGAP